MSKAGNYLLIVGGGLLVLYFGNKLIQKVKFNEVSKKLGDDINVQQAVALRNAINPSGIEWMRQYDGTNEDAIFQIAAQITDFEKVSKAYYQLFFQRSLTNDLQSELSAEDFQKFLNLINNKGQTNVVNNQIKEKYIYTSSAVTIRKTPVKDDGNWWNAYQLDNVVKNVNAGVILGLATGNVFYDTENDVRFAEFKAKLKGETNFAKLLYVWTGAIQYYTTNELTSKFGNFDNRVLIFDKSDVNGLGTINNSVVTKQAANIYKNDRYYYETVPANVKLGTFVSAFQCSKVPEKMIKFRTFNNIELNVSAKDIIIK